MKLPIPWNRPKGKQRKKQIFPPLVFFFRRAKFGPYLESSYPHRGKRGTLGMEAPAHCLNLPRSP